MQMITIGFSISIIFIILIFLVIFLILKIVTLFDHFQFRTWKITLRRNQIRFASSESSKHNPSTQNRNPFWLSSNHSNSDKDGFNNLKCLVWIFLYQIFTNSDRNHAIEVLNRLGIRDCFEQIICFETLNPNLSKSITPEEFPVLLKPSSEAFKIAVDVADIDPTRTVRT